MRHQGSFANTGPGESRDARAAFVTRRVCGVVHGVGMRLVAPAVAVIVSVLGASGCASSGPKQTAHYAASPPTTSAGVPPASSRRHEIQVARSSNRLFAIFPLLAGERRCAIPVGGPVKTSFRGTCQTSVHRAQTHEPAMIVAFTERWRRPACAPALAAACPHPMAHHTWQVVEGEPIVTTGATFNVLATRPSGATAPQDYK